MGFRLPAGFVFCFSVKGCLLGGKVTLFSGVGFPFLEFLRFGEYSVPGAIGMVVAFGVSLALGLVFGFEKAQQKN